MRTITHWIDGKPWDGESKRFGDIYDPAAGEIQARVALASESDVDRAVAVALAAFRDWRDVALSARVRILFAFRNLVVERREELARLVNSEHGKTVPDALGEIDRGLEVVEFACGIPHLLKGSYTENASTNVDTFSIRQPLGVVAGITPFNFPAMVPMWMHPLAIACGNSFVLKPSEKDPSASNFVAELWAEAGLPGGVFNVVHGDVVAVNRILEHSDISAVSFVGSTPIAKHIYDRATATGKRVQALGGAKNHMVVLPDADLESAAEAATSASCGSAGERCMAISVVVAVGDIADTLVENISRKMSGLEIGVDMGPLVTGDHRDRVAGYVGAGEQSGATLVLDGRDLLQRDGFYVGPCLFDNVTTDMSIYTDEIFGPVLCVVRVRDDDEAIDLVNTSAYGNGVAIFTSDGGAARRFQRDVQIGMVGVNVPIPVPMSYYSFGGWKQSLMGDLHIYGPEGVQFYTRGKVVTSRWTAGRHQTSFPTT